MKVLTLVSVATALVAPRDICTGPYAPVCGVDGGTYDNECYINNAGVAKAHDGTCEDVPTTTIPATTTTTTTTATPTVTIRHSLCLSRPNEVCGVNGLTYRNECYLLRAGVSKDHDGPCSFFK